MSDEDTIWFGKYKGTKLADVPARYLLWLWDNGIWAEKEHKLHGYIKETFTALEDDARDYIVQHPPK
jgi:uncharacterized protein (DUF3820 family)